MAFDPVATREQVLERRYARGLRVAWVLWVLLVATLAAGGWWILAAVEELDALQGAGPAAGVGGPGALGAPGGVPGDLGTWAPVLAPALALPAPLSGEIAAIPHELVGAAEGLAALLVAGDPAGLDRLLNHTSSALGTVQHALGEPLPPSAVTPLRELADALQSFRVGTWELRQLQAERQGKAQGQGEGQAEGRASRDQEPTSLWFVRDLGTGPPAGLQAAVDGANQGQQFLARVTELRRMSELAMAARRALQGREQEAAQAALQSWEAAGATARAGWRQDLWARLAATGAAATVVALVLVWVVSQPVRAARKRRLAQRTRTVPELVRAELAAAELVEEQAQEQAQQQAQQVKAPGQEVQGGQEGEGGEGMAPEPGAAAPGAARTTPAQAEPLGQAPQPVAASNEEAALELLVEGNTFVAGSSKPASKAAPAGAPEPALRQEPGGREPTERPEPAEVRQESAARAPRTAEDGERERLASALAQLAEDLRVLSVTGAVEAARMGEAGRPFAVVAEELRRVAERARREARRTGLRRPPADAR